MRKFSALSSQRHAVRNAILHWNGQRFVSEDAGISATLYAAWTDGSDTVWAAGSDGALYRREAGSWTSWATDSSSALRAVHGTSDGVFVAGSSSALWRWDGSVGTREATPCGGSMLGLGLVGSELLSVGESYCMAKRSGGTWVSMTAPSMLPTDKNGYFSVVASSSGTTWVSGRPGNLFRFDGSTWTQLELKTMEVASSLWASPGGEVWIGGTDLYKVSSSLPSRVNARPQEAIYSLSAATAETLWAVGFAGTVLRRSGTTWEPIRSEATSALYGVYSPSDEVAYVIGFDAAGSTLSMCANRACSLIEKPRAGIEYSAIHGVDANTFWVVGKGGVVRTWNAKNAALADDTSMLGSSAALNQVFAIDSSLVYAVGEQGLVALREASGWRADISAPTGRQSLQALWASSSADVWIGGTNGFAAHFDGASWSVVQTGISDSISAISGTGPSDVWAVTLQGSVLRYDGQRFVIVSQSELPRLHSIVGKDGHLYLAGALGTILHKSPPSQ